MTHPEFLRVLAEAHRADLLRSQRFRHKRRTLSETRHPLTCIRSFVGTVLVRAGARLLKIPDARVKLSDAGGSINRGSHIDPHVLQQRIFREMTQGTQNQASTRMSVATEEY